MDTISAHNQVPRVLFVASGFDNRMSFPIFDRYDFLTRMDSLFVLQLPIEDRKKFLALEE